MKNETSSSKEEMVAVALTNGGAKLIAVIVGQPVDVKSGTGGLDLPVGTYAIIALPPASATPPGVYLTGGKPAADPVDKPKEVAKM
jgi:hypothetical protein